MNKKLTTTLAIGATIVGGAIVTSDVHAADVQPTNENDNLVVKTTTNPNPTVTKTQVEEAKEKFDNAKAKFDGKKVETENKIADATKTKAEINKLEDIAKISENITDKDIKDAETKVSDLTAKKDELSKSIDNKANEVESKDTKITLGAVKVDKAQKDLDKAIEKETEIKNEINSVADTSEEVRNARVDVETAKSELEKAKANVAKAEAKVTDENAKDAENATKLGIATTVLNGAKSTETTKEQAVKTAEDKEKELKAKLDASTDVFAGLDTSMSLDPKFVEVFERYLNGQASIHDVIAVEKSLTNKIEYPQSYNYADETEMIDLKNISKEEEMKMAQYFTTLLNKIRAQFGKDNIQVNLVTQEFANEVAKIIMRDDYSGSGHYVKGITEAAGKFGLSTEDNYYENLFTGHMKSQDGTSVSRKQLYDTIRYFTQGFFYEGTVNGYYSHAKSLLKINDNLGVAFSITNPKEELYRDFKLKTIKMSVLNVSPMTIKADTNKEMKAIYESKFSKNSSNAVPLVKPVDNSKLQDEYEQAKLALQTAKSDLAKAQADVKEAQANVYALKAYKSNSDVAQNELELAKAEVVKAEDKVKTTESKLAELKAKTESENEIIKALEAKLSIASQNVTEARELLKIAQDELKLAETAKTDAMAELKGLENELATITTELETATAAKDRLVELKANHADTLEKLTKARETYEVFTKDIESLQAVLKDLEVDAQAQYDEYIKVKRQFDLENLTYAVTQNPPVFELPEFNPNQVPPVGNVVEPIEQNEPTLPATLEKPVVSDVTHSTIVQNPTHGQNTSRVVKPKATLRAGKLPATGLADDLSRPMSVMTLLLASAGLVLNRRKEQE